MAVVAPVLGDECERRVRIGVPDRGDGGGEVHVGEWTSSGRWSGRQAHVQTRPRQQGRWPGSVSGRRGGAGAD
jgi:hypothetical protein